MNECGGVLVPDGDNWRRTCFVEERSNEAELASIIYADGTRPLQPSGDHYWPLSNWPDSVRMHTVHLYCQHVQAGMINVANGNLAVGRSTQESAGYPALAAGRAVMAAAGYPNSAKGLTVQKSAGYAGLIKVRAFMAAAG